MQIADIKNKQHETGGKVEWWKGGKGYVAQSEESEKRHSQSELFLYATQQEGQPTTRTCCTLRATFLH